MPLRSKHVTSNLYFITILIVSLIFSLQQLSTKRKQRLEL